MRILFGFMFCLMLLACGGGSDSGQSATQSAPAAPKDDGKGIGEITEVALNDPLDQEMVARGQEIYDLKCSACHKLTGQRVVGPGFQGVTERRKPEWIMNMITNTDAMLEKDPQAQALLEECLTRMPNQNVALNEARDILEFFLSNDQSKK